MLNIIVPKKSAARNLSKKQKQKQKQTEIQTQPLARTTGYSQSSSAISGGHIMLSQFSTLKQNIIDSNNLVDFFNFNLDINVPHSGACISAPDFIRHGDFNPSFAVYDDHAFDFATQHYYNILDIYALAHFGDKDNFANIIKAAEALSGQHISFRSDLKSDSIIQQQQAFNQLIAQWHKNLLDNPTINPSGRDIKALDYFAERRISIGTIKALKLGYVRASSVCSSGAEKQDYMHDRLIIPYYMYGLDNPFYAAGRAAIPVSPLFPKYKKMSLSDSRFNLILRNSVWGVQSQKPNLTVRDTQINPDTGEEITLETHHIRYDFLVIAEGAFDALSFWQEGYQVASSLGCGFSQEQKKQILQSAKHYAEKGKKVFLCLDNDGAGLKGQHSLALFLFKNRIPFVVGQVPKSFTVCLPNHPQFGQSVKLKDVSDYYSAGGDLAELILNAKPGTAFLAEFCRNEDELKKLFEDTAKLALPFDLFKLKEAAYDVMDDNGEVEYLDKKTGEVRRVMDKKPRFNRKTVSFLYKETAKPLTDKALCELTCKAHQLMYDPLGQFYEYRAGIWRAVSDAVVNNFVLNAVSGELSSAKITSAVRYLKSALIRENLLFNTKPIWVFRNGTLWLDERDGMNDEFSNLDGSKADYKRTSPKNFKPSTPDDMSTIQMPYDYRYGAVNKTWERYVAEWLNGQQDKITLFQQMFGYVLFAVNKLQKFFYLIGDGANGKSTALHILEHVFGKDNCSSLQFHRFNSEFDTIALKNSRVNICYDARTELGGAEDVLKAVTSGDTIMAAHKGVDAEAFTTNAKIFVAANRYFSASDVSKGLLRRILFLCFDQDFSGSGQKIDIEDEIKDDPGGLAGVFNWAYEGYKMLKKDGRFVETEEQKRLLEEFKSQLSPLMVFARDELYGRTDCEVNERSLYTFYSEWCKANGERRLSRTKFIYEIRQVLRTDGADIITEKDSESGLFIFKFPAGKEDDKSGQEVQSQEAPADEGSALVHPGELSGDTFTWKHEGTHEDRKALQEESRALERRKTTDPNYVHEEEGYWTGHTNDEIWTFGWKFINALSKHGRKWQAVAYDNIRQWRIYEAMQMYFAHNKEADPEGILPGWNKFIDSLRYKFSFSLDEYGTMKPLQF